ncbi:hypothetical protein FIM78_06050 [Helicobacter pylori]|nr:hypothetical protein FIM78_06050 [Helicobacter pylori]
MGGFDLFLFDNPHYFRFLIFKFLFFFWGFDEKSFLAFFILVSGKLDDKLSDNLLKKCFFLYGNFSCEL